MQDGNERWKFVKGSDHIVVSDRGRMLTLNYETPRFLSGSITPKGYVRVKIDGGASVFVHRIVADAWIENDDPIHKTQINHKNGNKQDNRVVNLELCTPSENLQHSYDELGRIPSAKGRVVSKETRMKLSKKLKGRVITEEWRKNMSISRIGKQTLGDNPRAKKTICLETGEIFKCAKSAALKFGVCYRSVTQSIRKGSCVSGKYHFSYVK